MSGVACPNRSELARILPADPPTASTSRSALRVPDLTAGRVRILQTVTTIPDQGARDRRGWHDMGGIAPDDARRVTNSSGEARGTFSAR